MIAILEGPAAGSVRALFIDMRARRRDAIALGLGLLLALDVVGADVPAVKPTEPASARRADLEFARVSYVEKSSAFTPASRRAALEFIARALPRVGAMSPAEYLVTVARIPAFADNAHDVFRSGDDSWWPDTRLPVKLLWFSDGLLVARAAPEQASLLGGRVTRIEGLAPGELLERLHAICGGPESYRRWNALWVLGNGGLLHALGIARSPSALRLELEQRDGRRQRVELPYVPQASMPWSLRPTRLLSADLVAAEVAKGWRVAAPSDPLPLYQQQPDTLYRAQRLAALDALYVQLRSNMDEDGQQFVPFLESTLADARASPPRNLVLDLRFDVGGDISLSRQYLRQLVGLASERVYVLVGPYTFSAGLVSAAAAAHDGGGRATIVGEQAGDRLRFWSEGARACLPNSRYCLRRTDGLWDLVRGCKSEPNCYGDPFDATIGSLRPRLLAPLTAAAWLAGRDPAMEAISKDLGRP
jgi:hypothetical protein